MGASYSRYQTLPMFTLKKNPKGAGSSLLWWKGVKMEVENLALSIKVEGCGNTRIYRVSELEIAKWGGKARDLLCL